MSTITKNIVSSINSNDADKFLMLISNISLNELKDVNYDEIDSKLMNSKQFSLKHKLIYAKYYNRSIYRQILEETVSNIYGNDYDALLFVARAEEYFRKQILDVLVVRTLDNDRKEQFIYQLQSSNLYEKYIESLMNGNDSVAKILFAIRFGFIDAFYQSSLNLAKVIVNTDVFKGSFSGKSDVLMELSKNTTDRDTLEYIEKSLEKVVSEETKDFYDGTYAELGIKKDNSKEKESTIKRKLSYCLNMIKRKF